MKPNEALKKIMDERGIRRVDMERLTGIPQNEISRYLNGKDGKRDIKANRLLSILRALPADAQATFWLLLRDLELPAANDMEGSMVGERQGSTELIAA